MSLFFIVASLLPTYRFVKNFSIQLSKAKEEEEILQRSVNAYPRSLNGGGWVGGGGGVTSNVLSRISSKI